MNYDFLKYNFNTYHYERYMYLLPLQKNNRPTLVIHQLQGYMMITSDSFNRGNSYIIYFELSRNAIGHLSMPSLMTGVQVGDLRHMWCFYLNFRCLRTRSVNPSKAHTKSDCNILIYYIQNQGYKITTQNSLTGCHATVMQTIFNIFPLPNYKHFLEFWGS